MYRIVSKFKREPHEVGLPPRAAGGGPDYFHGIPKDQLNSKNVGVVLLVGLSKHDRKTIIKNLLYPSR